MSGLPQTADGPVQGEPLFDPLALDLADAIAGMTGRARIDDRAAVAAKTADDHCCAVRNVSDGPHNGIDGLALFAFLISSKGTTAWPSGNAL